MSPELSILVVSRSKQNIARLFATIPQAIGKSSYEVLVSWNGDDELDITDHKTMGGELRVFDIRPYHFSRNNNQLADAAEGQYLLFINDDILLDPDSLDIALRQIRQSDVGIVGANLRYPGGQVQHAGVFVRDDLSPFHIYKKECYYLDPRVSYDREVPAVTGAFILIRKDEFQAVRFDERCRVAAQDVILCFRYRSLFTRKVIYVAKATAIHHENETRKLFDQRTTPPEDLALMNEVIREQYADELENGTGHDEIRLRIVTEGPGWIMYRKGEEIAKRLKHAVINEDDADANIHYYINYGYFRARPKSGIVVANFTHYDPSLHSDAWERAAKEVDHCVAVSEEAAKNIKRFGIPQEKISVIKVGADVAFRPRMTLGIVGRVYPGGRKGEHLVRELLEDSELMNGLQIVSTNEGWGVPVWSLTDPGDFYRAIDYLLVPSLIEGGPVPFMEALACGTMSIAPPIGVVPEFPHIEYKTGDIESLKSVITTCKRHYLERKQLIARHMANYNWSTWALQHISLFKKLLRMN